MEDLNPFDLNKILRSFFVTIKKKDGDDYEPGSLRGIFSSIERHLLSKKYIDLAQLSTEMAFKDSRDVLSTKMKELKQQRRGRFPNRCESVSEEEAEDKGILGSDNPVSLQNTIWWRLFYGLRRLTTGA